MILGQLPPARRVLLLRPSAGAAPLILVADVGWNDMVCKTACLTPDSLKGQKMRVSPSQA